MALAGVLDGPPNVLHLLPEQLLNLPRPQLVGNLAAALAANHPDASSCARDDILANQLKERRASDISSSDTCIDANCFGCIKRFLTLAERRSRLPAIIADINDARAAVRPSVALERE